jgi:hypothetical protein
MVLAAEEAIELVEAACQRVLRVRLAEMPFADERGPITPSAQVLDEGRFGRGQARTGNRPVAGSRIELVAEAQYGAET